jgi:hypothetical protein
MLDDLIQGLFEYLGVVPLEPNAQGGFEIVFDETLGLEILPLTSTQFLLRSELTELPDDEGERHACLQELLQNNLLLSKQQRNSLSLDRETGRIWLYRMARADRIDRQEFCELISSFVTTLEWWRKRDGDSAPISPALALMPHSFLRP